MWSSEDVSNIPMSKNSKQKSTQIPFGVDGCINGCIFMQENPSHQKEQTVHNLMQPGGYVSPTQWHTTEATHMGAQIVSPFA